MKMSGDCFTNKNISVLSLKGVCVCLVKGKGVEADENKDGPKGGGRGGGLLRSSTSHLKELSLGILSYFGQNYLFVEGNLKTAVY